MEQELWAPGTALLMGGTFGLDRQHVVKAEDQSAP